MSVGGSRMSMLLCVLWHPGVAHRRILRDVALLGRLLHVVLVAHWIIWRHAIPLLWVGRHVRVSRHTTCRTIGISTDMSEIPPEGLTRHVRMTLWVVQDVSGVAGRVVHAILATGCRRGRVQACL